MQHIYQPLDPILFNIGPLTLYKYAFMILIGVIVALYFGIKEGERIGIDKSLILDGLIIILPLAILGARFWYILFDGAHNFSHFFPFAGLAIHGGIAVALIGTYVFAKKRQVSLFKLYDVLAPGLLIGQIFGRWGNFFNQEAHGGIIGGVTQQGQMMLSLDAQRSFLSNTLRLPNFIVNQIYGSSYMANTAYYHPTFLYESVWNIVGLSIMLILRRTKYLRSGDLIGFYLMWYSFGRYFIEILRTDALMFFNTSLRSAQLTSILLFGLGLFIILLNHYKVRPLYSSYLSS